MEEDPITRFEREHDEALSVLESLEKTARALAEGDELASHRETVGDAHDFLAGAVRRHNEDEERALFPLLEDGPTGVFVEEHRELRALEERLRATIRGEDSAAVARVALDLIDLLRAHIRRENEVLFPVARERLGPSGLAEVARRLT